MNEAESPPVKRIRLSGEELNRIDKDEIISLYMKQQVAMDQLKSKNGDKDVEEKCKIAETTRRENVLVMRLAAKEQEIQQYAAQITHIKKSQEDAAAKSLRQAMLDPAVNLMFTKMREELKETKDKLEQAQSELSAWKFTPDSQTGKKLMSRCRTLIAENQELGRQLSQGKVAQLEAELALQKKYSEELKQSQEELNEFVIQLDEEVEGMQSTIQKLQQQLVESRKDVEKYKKLCETRDYDSLERTALIRNDSRTPSMERRVSPIKKEAHGNLGNYENEVGNESDSLRDGAGSPNASYENSEFVCKEECKSDDGDGTSGENPVPMDVDRKRYPGTALPAKENDGENTPTYSEHEIIDESRGTSPEREYSDGDAESANGGHRYVQPPSVGSESPMHEEAYQIIDNGSDDDSEHVTHIISTADPLEAEETRPIHPEVKSADAKGGANCEECINGVDDSPSDVNKPETRTKGSTAEEKAENIDTVSTLNTEADKEKTEEIKVAKEEEERTTNKSQAIDVVVTSVAVPPTSTEAPPAYSEPKVVCSSTKTNGEQAPVTAPSSQPPNPIKPAVPAVKPADPPYLMGHPYSQLPSTTLSQQQALMAEHASLMYSLMAQQQQRQLNAENEKKTQGAETNPGARTAEELRGPNPLMHGLPYPDPSAALFAQQYKAMLAAQQMLMSGPEGKPAQMIMPGGLGLYPGLPLVQPTILPPSTADHATNGVTSSWGTNTNVTYTPHPLLPQGYLGATQPGLMMFPGPNLTPHSAIPIVEGEKHQGSGDHGPIQNGLPDTKQPETTDTNPKEEQKAAL